MCISVSFSHPIKLIFCHLYMPNNAVGGHWCVLGENCKLFSAARKGRPNHFERAPVKSLFMLTLLHFGGFVLLYLGISLPCAIAASWDHTQKSCNRDFPVWRSEPVVASLCFYYQRGMHPSITWLPETLAHFLNSILPLLVYLQGQDLLLSNSASCGEKHWQNLWQLFYLICYQVYIDHE